MAVIYVEVNLKLPVGAQCLSTLATNTVAAAHIIAPAVDPVAMDTLMTLYQTTALMIELMEATTPCCH